VAGRIFVTPVSAEGRRLRFFTDTGGGLFVLGSTVERVDLETLRVGEGEDASTLALFPEYRAETWIPGISVADDPRPDGFRGRLFVMPGDDRTTKQNVGDGMLGAVWFAGRSWTLDYPRERFVLHEPGETPDMELSHTLDLGFLVDEEGRRLTHFASMEATIDGESLPFLLDTGATVVLTDSAAEALGSGEPQQRATSFITESVFSRWRRAHPDWRVIEDADLNVTGSPMIEVPEVEVAGHKVGPVWFTRRPDTNFHDYMSRMMDRKVEGALGASLFRYFEMTVDFPSARVWLRREAEEGTE
jgi:hypothetical protein